jgi:thioredoxin-dependent peroxiredoxin
MSKLPEVGQAAPEFQTPIEDGRVVSLKDFRGKPIVLYFYPKDDTPGCTKEACGFRDAWKDFQKAGAVVLGVSPDSPKSHQKFIQKFQLPFSLLADEEKKIVQDYGVWGEKKFMGRKYMGVFRTTFLIDGEGKIQKVWPQVKPEEHASEVLEAVRAVQ